MRVGGVAGFGTTRRSRSSRAGDPGTARRCGRRGRGRGARGRSGRYRAASASYADAASSIVSPALRIEWIARGFTWSSSTCAPCPRWSRGRRRAPSARRRSSTSTSHQSTAASASARSTPGGATARQRDRAGRDLPDDAANAVGTSSTTRISPFIGGHAAILRRWIAAPWRCTRHARPSWRDAPRGAVPRPRRPRSADRCRAGAVVGRSRVRRRAAPPVPAPARGRARRGRGDGRSRARRRARRAGRPGRPRSAAVPARRARRRVGARELPARAARPVAAGAHGAAPRARGRRARAPHDDARARAKDVPRRRVPGRFFARWNSDELHDVLIGAGFDVSTCAPTTGPTSGSTCSCAAAAPCPTPSAPGMRLLVCGLNPSVYAADAGVGFARPGNRFWPAALAAGRRDPRPRRPPPAPPRRRRHDRPREAGHRACRRAHPRRVPRRAPRASSDWCAWLRPGAVCFVGLAGWRAAVDRKAQPGVQPDAFGGAPPT